MQRCYVHLLFKDLSAGSFLQDFKTQHGLGEEGLVNLLRISMKSKGYFWHFSLKDSLMQIWKHWAMHTTVPTKMRGGQVCIYHSYQQSIHIPSFHSLLPNSFLFFTFLLGFLGLKKIFLWAKIIRPFRKPCLIPQDAWFLSLHSTWISLHLNCPSIYLYFVWGHKVNEGRFCLSCRPLQPWSLEQPWNKVGAQ